MISVFETWIAGCSINLTCCSHLSSKLGNCRVARYFGIDTIVWVRPVSRMFLFSCKLRAQLITMEPWNTSKRSLLVSLFRTPRACLNEEGAPLSVALDGTAGTEGKEFLSTSCQNREILEAFGRGLGTEPSCMPNVRGGIPSYNVDRYGLSCDGLVQGSSPWLLVGCFSTLSSVIRICGVVHKGFKAPYRNMVRRNLGTFHFSCIAILTADLLTQLRR